MKKLNKKGVTLIELIVSFAIVSVALIYFYQTIVDLHRMYKNSNKATDEFVNKDYALRVLDAYIEKKGVSSLDNVCENYLLSYCSTAEVTKDGVFSKVELKKDSEVLVTSYYYTSSKLVDAIITYAIGTDGNVKSLTDLQSTIENQVDESEKNKYSYEQSITEDGKVKYEVIYTDSSKTPPTTIYTKVDNETIDTKLKEKLADEPITETNANKFLAVINSNWIVSNANVYYDEKENKYYATYDVIKKDSKKLVAKNVIKISELEKLTSIENVNGEDQIEKEYNLSNGNYPSGYMKETENKKFILKYMISSNEETTKLDSSWEDKCILAIYQEKEKKIEIFFDKNGINHKQADDPYSSLTNNIVYQEVNGNKYITFNNISFYSYWYKNYDRTDDICKIKLVEAYKYNN